MYEAASVYDTQILHAEFYIRSKALLAFVAYDTYYLKKKIAVCSHGCALLLTLA